MRKLHQQSWEISKQSHRLQTTRLKLPHTRLTWTKTKNKNRKKTKKATDIKPYWRNYYHRTQRASFFLTFSLQVHCVKSVRIWSFSCPYFPAFGLNTERYFVSLHIQSEFGKMWSRKTPNMGPFHAVVPEAMAYANRIVWNKRMNFNQLWSFWQCYMINLLSKKVRLQFLKIALYVVFVLSFRWYPSRVGVFWVVHVCI